MTVAPGYPNPDAVASARKGAARSLAHGQAVPADHARVLLGALAFCEQTIDEYAGLIGQLVDERWGPGMTADEFRAKYLDGGS